jgi:signal transduction histidine kinase/DNA-binding response OmpR family regulator
MSAQVWSLKDSYPLELPDGEKYAQCPDSLIKVFQSHSNATLAEIQRKSNLFTSNPEKIHLSKGEVYWLKTELHNKNEITAKYLIEVDAFYFQWSLIDIYLVKGGSETKNIRTGNSLKPRDKPIRDARNLCWVTLEPGESQEIYVKLQSGIDIHRSGLGLRVFDRNSMQDFEGLVLRELPKNNRREQWPMKHLLYVRYGLEYFIDTLNRHSPSDIRNNWDELATFYREENLNLAAENIVWCRHKIINAKNQPQQHFFDIGGDLPKIEVYLPTNEQDFEKIVTGKSIPLSNKPVPSALNMISFEVAASDTVYVYFKCFPLEKIPSFKYISYGGPLIYSYEHEVLDLIRKTSLWKGVFLGIFIFQFIYFALRSLLEKDILGYYYTIFILGFLFAFLYSENLVNSFIALQIFWDYNHIMMFLSYTLTAIGIYLFTNRYLQQNEFTPLAYRTQGVILALIILFQIVLLIQQSVGEYHETSWFYRLDFFSYTWNAIGCFLLFNIIFVIVALIKKQPHALSYLLAFGSFYLVGIMNSILYIRYDQLPHSQYSLTYVSFIVSNILFAIIVAKRNNEMKLKEVRTEGLIQLNTERSRFYANITHEFRTPLTVILGLAEKSEQYFANRNMAKFHEVNDIVQRNGHRLLNLVNQMLDLSRLEFSSIPTHIVQGDIVIFLKNLVAMYESHAENSNLKLSFESALPELIMDFDTENLQKILTNLLTNAIKFTDKGFVKVVLSEKSIKEKRFAQIKVEDSGIGIAKESVAKIFERFYQVKREEGVTYEGSGIGMSLVKELVEMMNGHVDIESELGIGTAVRFTLPISKEAPLVENSLELLNMITEKSPGKPATSERQRERENLSTVLLIEDNQDVLYYLHTCLGDHYLLIQALDGEEGISKALEEIPDIIISDIVMPKKTGYEVCETLKLDTRTSHIPIVLLTAKVEIQDRISGIKHGADAYLVKPFNVDELLVQIDNLIRSRALLIEKFKMYQADQLDDQPYAERENEFLQNLNNLITKEMSNSELNVDTVCDSLSMSRTQLHRKIKALTDKSITAYIRSFRLSKALKLIKSTTLTIQQIAYETGFSDSSYFHKSFVKEYNKKPTEFRK